MAPPSLNDGVHLHTTKSRSLGRSRTGRFVKQNAPLFTPIHLSVTFKIRLHKGSLSNFHFTIQPAPYLILGSALHQRVEHSCPSVSSWPVEYYGVCMYELRSIISNFLFHECSSVNIPQTGLLHCIDHSKPACAYAKASATRVSLAELLGTTLALTGMHHLEHSFS